MATIGLQPINMRDATLAIEADDYSVSINQVLFVPRPEYIWITPYLEVNSFPAPTTTVWTVSLGYAQDLTTAGALSTYLLEHAAQQKVVTFTVPGMVVAATVLILPGQFGGVINQIPAATVTLPLYGPPDLGPVT